MSDARPGVQRCSLDGTLGGPSIYLFLQAVRFQPKMPPPPIPLLNTTTLGTRMFEKML